jgi:trehalose 6-phosphate phosphatase
VSLAEVRTRLARAALLFDFDGTLSPIVARPQDARPVDGAVEVLRGLLSRAASLTIVSGRREPFLRTQLPLEGLAVVGLHGVDPDHRMSPDVVDAVRSIAAGEPGAVAEEKIATVAIHVRQARDPDAAAERIAPLMAALAQRHGLRVLQGRRVLELVPPGAGKGEVVARIVERDGVEAALYAGDDVGDVPAFTALEEAAARGVAICRVAVVGDETPSELRERADVRVPSPEALVRLLRDLERA